MIRIPFRLPVVAIAFLSLWGCGLLDHKSKDDDSKVKGLDGLIGTTCYAEPVVKDENGRNVCLRPDSNWPGLSNGTMFYSITPMMIAKKAAINACQQANALDYGEKFGTSCYKECETVVYCLPLTPNPD